MENQTPEEFAMTLLVETESDGAIRDCLENKRSFSVVAGAGSGKTTALITALHHLRDTVGARLRRDDKRIVCITYTNRAVEVISKRLEWDDLFRISTLHKFLWGEIRRFTPDIRDVLRNHVIPGHIQKKKEDDNGGQNKKAIAARERIEELEAAIQSLITVETFEYNDSKFSDYAAGKLGHDDVINVAACLISQSEPLQRILGQKYPYIFVDEAQDTFGNVVDALNKVCENDGLPLVGYFGDPVQQIYDERAGGFQGPAGSVVIKKEDNFRCSCSVIRLLNAFRKDIQQVARGKNADVEGSVLIRLVRAEAPEGARRQYSEAQVDRALARFDQVLDEWGWKDNADVKLLFLVRQMIARRLGFPKLQKLFTGQFASSNAQEDYEKGEHFLLKPFADSLCPLMKAYRDGNGRLVIDILRRFSPAMSADGANALRPLGEMKEKVVAITKGLHDVWGKGSLREILGYCREHQVCEVSDRLAVHLDRERRHEKYDPDVHSIDKGEWLADEFLDMSTAEVEVFVEFISENTAYSTQHGVKGEEYRNVVVVFDDVEAAWNNYSFTKMLAPKTSGDPTEGQRDRSYKLAYVCFSRAEVNLRIVLFTPTPEAVMEEIVSRGLCDADQISIT